MFLNHVEGPKKQSFTNSSLGLAQKPLLEACANDTSVMPQDECDKTILDKVLEPVHDPNLQVHKNTSCEPMEVHNEQWLLLQKPFKLHVKLVWKIYPVMFCQNYCHVVSKFQKAIFHFSLSTSHCKCHLNLFKYNVSSGFSGRIISTISICLLYNGNRQKY